MNLNEEKDLILFKQLLTTLNDYVEHFPGTKVTGIFERCLNEGIKIIPKDAESRKLLENLLGADKSVPSRVQDLMNSKILK